VINLRPSTLRRRPRCAKKSPRMAGKLEALRARLESGGVSPAERERIEARLDLRTIERSLVEARSLGYRCGKGFRRRLWLRLGALREAEGPGRRKVYQEIADDIAGDAPLASASLDSTHGRNKKAKKSRRGPKRTTGRGSSELIARQVVRREERLARIRAALAESKRKRSHGSWRARSRSGS
jgi:hypothetical protein